jgi:hypothetical protein
MNDLNDPETITMDEEGTGRKPELEIITVVVKEQSFQVTPSEAVGIINQVSGVLLAYESSGGYEQSKKKYLNNI